MNKSIEERSSYRGIFKATSLFGGVQMYQILVSVIKSKFIAVLLGPLGVGILGLYQSAIQLIQSLTSMGLKSSAVRDVSEANGSGDLERVSAVIKCLRRLVWCTGLLGFLVVLVFSSVLSETTFGDNLHIVPFMCLSVTLLLDQICAGQNVVLQGMRRLKHLAMASSIGATISLLVSIPLYYIYGVKGIVPTLIISSITLLILSWYFARRVKLPHVDQTIKDTFSRGKGMLKMGLAMSWNGILVYGCGYILRWFIRIDTGTEAVGLFTAGFTIINSYVGMIFNALGTDYYPRLAAVNNNNDEMRIIVNQQGEIAALIMAPLLMICVVFMPIIIQILYSDSFSGANDYVILAAVGMMFKLGSWLIAYQFIAKGESKLYVINETITNVYFLIISIIAYKYYGLAGLGIATTICFLIYFLQVYAIARKKYDYRMSREFRGIMIIHITLLSVCLGTTILGGRSIVVIINGLLILCSAFYSIIELDSRMKLFHFLTNRFKQK